MKYLVITRINKVSYMVNVEAESHGAAEHKILDMSYCGIHEYGVETAQAFDNEDMKAGCFRDMALHSTTVSQKEIIEIIAERNRQIELKDLAEKRIREIEKQMKQLAEELENAKRILADN